MTPAVPLWRACARPLAVRAGELRVPLPQVAVGEHCHVRRAAGDAELLTHGVVTRVDHGIATVALLGAPSRLAADVLVVPTGQPLQVQLGAQLLGCVVDGFGEVVERLGADTSASAAAPTAAQAASVQAAALDYRQRRAIATPFDTGIRAVDALLTVGEGQRMGVFAAAGCGKTTLMEMLLTNADCDVRVVALIGERGREVAAFVEAIGSSPHAARTIVVQATSDTSPATRVNAAMVATRIAEYFREQGSRVLLVMDSASGARTVEAMSAMRLSPGSVPTVPTAPEKAPPAAVPPEAATPATEGGAPTAAKPGHTSAPVPPSAATPSSSGSPARMAAFNSPPSPGASAPGAGVQGAAQPAGAPHTSTATSDRAVGKERGAALLSPAATGADAAGDPDAASVMPRAPSSETAGAAGRQESNAAPLPALAAQDAATRHSAEAAAGEAGQARSEANIASQRNLQHVQQALKTAEVLANRASAGARMNVAFTSWGPGHSVSLSRQLGGHWTAIPSNARVGHALGSNTPSDLQVQAEGEHLRVEESSMTDPDGRRGQQREHDTA